MCARSPCSGLGSDGSRLLFPFCTAVQVAEQGGWGDALSFPKGRRSQLAYPLGNGAVILEQVVPAHAASKEHHGDTSRLHAPGEGISSRDHFVMTVLSPTLGKDGQHHSQAHPHLPEPQTAAAFKAPQEYSLLHGGLHSHQPQGAGNAASPCNSPPALLPSWAGEWTLCGSELWATGTGKGVSEPWDRGPCNSC